MALEYIICQVQQNKLLIEKNLNLWEKATNCDYDENVSLSHYYFTQLSLASHNVYDDILL